MTKKFKIGDRVVVVTHRWDTGNGGVQFGVAGVVVRAKGSQDDWAYTVRLDQKRKGQWELNYSASDLELESGYQSHMSEPDFSLEEIHRAQKLIKNADR